MAHKPSGFVGHSYEQDLKSLVRSHNLDDCSLTIHDVNNAHAIFGHDIAGVRGKTVGQKPDRVVTYYVAVPCDFLVLHKYVTLVTDVCFVSNAKILVTFSRGIKFVTVELISTRTAKQSSKILKRVMKLYTGEFMKVQTILMDMGFDKTVDGLMNNVVLNTSTGKELVTDIERCIRTIKEHSRDFVTTLLFN